MTTPAFPTFVLPSNYPNISTGYDVGNINNPKPTNSWYQVGISNADNDTVRHINATPWVWIPQYHSKNRPLSLYHNELKNYAINLNDGNFSVINDVFNAILINEQKVETTTLSDMSSIMKLYVGITQTITAYPSRGSPFASFFSNLHIISFSFSRGVIASTTASAFVNGGISGYKHKYIINSNKVNIVSEKMIKLGDNLDDTFTTKLLSIYNGTKPTSSKVIVIGTSSCVSIEFPDFDINVIVHRNSTKLVVNGITPNSLQGHWSNGGNNPNVWGLSFIKGSKTYNVEYSISNDGIRTATLTVTEPITYTFILYLPGQLNNIINNTTKTISSNVPYTGGFQFAIIPPGLSTSVASNLESFYDTYAYSYLVNSNTSTYGFDIFHWDIQRVNLTVDTLVMLPRHWNEYTITGIPNTSITRISGPVGYIHNSLTYGDLYYYKISSSMGIASFSADVKVPTITIPEKPDVSSFTSGEKSTLVNHILGTNINKNIGDTTVLKDIYTINVNTDPYTFGQQAATVGQICVLAKVLTDSGVSNPDLQFNGTGSTGTPLYEFRLMLLNAMKKWLQGNNLERYRLSYEARWKGIIVPADILNGPGAYGNSFYNDHHFHYGYFAYAIWALIYTGVDMSLYINQIKNLLYDVCNPDLVSTFSTKMRHKDFYGGHSWASGIGEFDKEKRPVGFVNRQQESSGEAINCYYSCYLLSKILNIPTVRDAGALALKLELDASKYYYQLQAPGSKTGDFTKVASIGIIQSFGKSFTLDWPMQPNTFPGRTLGLYGIQSLPFTEISFTHITKEWSNSIGSNSNNILYRITQELVKGLTDNKYIPLYPTKSIEFNTKDGGGYWGNVGLMMLSPGDYSTKVLWDAWNNLIKKQSNHTGRTIKSFDSYSNTLYWLIRNGVFKTGDVTITVTEIILLKCLKIVGVYKESTGIMIMKIISRCNVKCISVPLRDLVKGGDEYTLSEKAINLNTTVSELMEYAMIKITLVYITGSFCGNINPETILQSSNNSYILKKISENKGCSYLKLLSQYKGFNNFFV